MNPCPKTSPQELLRVHSVVNIPSLTVPQTKQLTQYLLIHDASQRIHAFTFTTNIRPMLCRGPQSKDGCTLGSY